MRIKRALMCLGLMICWGALAQTPIPAAGPSAPQATLTVSPAPLTTELQVLRAQLEESRRFQEQTLNTVYWALGTLATAAAALIAFGWFTNFKVYERDKLAMQRDLQTTIAEARITLEEELRGKVDALSTALRSELSEQVSQASVVAATATATATATLEKAIKDAALAARAGCDALRNEINQLKYKNLVQQHKSETYSRSRLQDAVTVMELALKLPYDGTSVPDALDLISKDIDQIAREQRADTDDTIDSYLMAQVFEVLGAVKDSHAPVAQAISKRAGSLRTG